MARIVLNDLRRSSIIDQAKSKSAEIQQPNVFSVMRVLRYNKSQKLKKRSRITQLFAGTAIIGFVTVACIATGNFIIGGILFTSFVSMFLA